MHWYAGKLIESETIALPISDPGILYGATVFTTMRVWDGSIDHPLSFWVAHCDRLATSIRYFGWTGPNWGLLRQGAEQLAAHYPVLRLTLFADGREWITGRSLPPNLEQWQHTGVSAWVAPMAWGRSLPGHKTGNYLACWLALQQAQQQGCQEAILTDSAGNWLETSTGNLWGWYDNCWWTPPLQANADSDHADAPSKAHRNPPPDSLKGATILSGVARSHLMAVLRWHNIKLQESVWSSDLVTQFETLLYSNSVRHVVAIAEVHNPNYENQPALRFHPCHPRVQAIASLFKTVTPVCGTRNSNLG